MRRIAIFCGGTIESSVLKWVREDDWLVGADRGALFLLEQGLSPYFSIGDFDSVTEDERQRIEQSSQYFQPCDPVMKDDTDTALAFKWALTQHPEEIVIFGALGGRFDHALSNVHLLRLAMKRSIACALIDAHNYIQLTNGELVVKRSEFSYVSLLPLTTEVTGIDLDGFKYPLHDAHLVMGQSIGISNELLEDEATIKLKSGELLVIQSKD